MEFTTIINQPEELRLWRSKLKEEKSLQRRAKRAAKDGLIKEKEETKCMTSLKQLHLKI